MAGNEIYYFPHGLPGFENCHHLKMVRDENTSLAQLFNVEDEQIGFIIASPFSLFPDYDFEIDEESKKHLQISGREEDLQIEVWAIITNNSDFSKITVNLRAPVLLNLKEKIGLQLILNDDRYNFKQPIPLTENNRKGDD